MIIRLTVLACLAFSSVTFLAIVQKNGWTLWYGDAEAHLAIARRVIDSRTPGYDQIGTVWLPLPHLLMLPLVGSEFLFRTGLAGAIPSAIGFVLSGWFLFLAAERVFGSAACALAVTGVFASNPNVLYLQATPMTEPLMFAAISVLLWATVAFQQSGSFRYVAISGLASVAASLTRYEGWFLIPFITGYFLLAPRRRVQGALLFAVIASVGPLYWMAHNWWYFGDALDFYRGPYGPKAIQGGKPYPGLHDWRLAWLYYRSTVGLVAGWGACISGIAGAVIALWKRVWWPVLFLALSPAFYVWSMESSSGSPIFIPTLWPFSYYNSRYGLAALPLLAMGAGALLLPVPVRWRPAIASAIICIAALPWLVRPQPDAWVCWKESEVNSRSRRAWAGQASEYLEHHYHPGSGIFSALGDQARVFREAGIPFRDVLQEGNGPAWLGAVAKPALFLHESWALAIHGDQVWQTVSRRPEYVLEKSIITPGAAPVEIFRLN